MHIAWSCITVAQPWCMVSNMWQHITSTHWSHNSVWHHSNHIIWSLAGENYVAWVSPMVTVTGRLAACNTCHTKSINVEGTEQVACMCSYGCGCMYACVWLCCELYNCNTNTHNTIFNLHVQPNIAHHTLIKHVHIQQIVWLTAGYRMWRFHDIMKSSWKYMTC